MRAKIVDNGVLKYPYTNEDIESEYPANTSLPAKPWPSVFYARHNAIEVEVTPWPTYDRYTQAVQELDPVYNAVSGVWEQAWGIVSLSPAEQQAARAQLISSVQEQTQQRLDSFAQTRYYAGMLSLCTYSTSTSAKFQAEGQYGVDVRDATWSKLHEILAEVQAGTRPMPTSYADIEPELPALNWPEGV